MIRLDSTKIGLPIDVMRSYDKSLFFEDIKKRDGVELSRKWKVDNVKAGLKSIEVNEGKNEVIIEASAKILLDDYYDGITINNIERVFDEVNNTGLIELDVNKSIDDGKIYRTDATDNLEIKENAGKYIDAIGIVSGVNGKYKTTSYKQVSKNEGIVMNADFKTFKERLIFYKKGAELLKSYNKAFFSELDKKGSAGKVLEQFKNTLRCESNNTTFEKIRQRFGVTEMNLIDILESSKRVNYDLFQKITSPIVQLDLFSDIYDGLPFYKIEKIEGRKAIIEKLNYDINLIKIFIERHVKGDIYSYLRQYKELIYSMKCGQDADYEYINLVNELSDLLKVA